VVSGVRLSVTACFDVSVTHGNVCQYYMMCCNNAANTGYSDIVPQWSYIACRMAYSTTEWNVANA